MVINVFVEGGVVNPNENVRTMDNTASLRQELHTIMQQILGAADIQIVLKTKAGYKNAAKIFIASDTPSYLYVDLDRVPDRRDEWFSDLEKENIVIPDELRDYVYFWIQEMEAWFLKQPQAIEDWAAEEDFERKPKAYPHISQHHHIKDRKIEYLCHKPSKVMSDILKNTFYSHKVKDKRKQSLKYGKLEHAPDILAHLNMKELLENDSELQKFRNHVLANLPHE